MALLRSQRPQGAPATRSLAGVVAGAVLVLLAACGTAHSPSGTVASSAPASGIVGQTLLSGGPVSRPAGAPNITVEVHSGDLAGPVVATAKSGAKGAFRFDLPPSRYTVTVVNPGGGTKWPVTVDVRPGSYATAKPILEVR